MSTELCKEGCPGGLPPYFLKFVRVQRGWTIHFLKIKGVPSPFFMHGLSQRYHFKYHIIVNKLASCASLKHKLNISKT